MNNFFHLHLKDLCLRKKLSSLPMKESYWPFTIEISIDQLSFTQWTRFCFICWNTFLHRAIHIFHKITLQTRGRQVKDVPYSGSSWLNVDAIVWDTISWVILQKYMRSHLILSILTKDRNGIHTGVPLNMVIFDFCISYTLFYYKNKWLYSIVI